MTENNQQIQPTIENQKVTVKTLVQIVAAVVVAYFALQVWVLSQEDARAAIEINNLKDVNRTQDTEISKLNTNIFLLCQAHNIKCKE